MLKSSPTHPTSPLPEDTIMLATDYALCAEAVAQQAMMMQPRSPASVLIMASMHELETLRRLLEARTPVNRRRS